MLNFEEELQKFKPIMEMDDVEETLFREELADTEDKPSSRRRTTDREDTRR